APRTLAPRVPSAAVPDGGAPAPPGRPRRGRRGRTDHDRLAAGARGRRRDRGRTGGRRDRDDGRRGVSKVGMAIEELHRVESALAAHLLRASDRHKADHEIFHLGRDLARWSQEHVRELARIGRDYDLDLDPEPAHDPNLLAAIRQKGSELLGRRHDPALLLLADLRDIHRMAAGASLDWEILAQ